MILQNFIFLDENSESTTSEQLSNITGSLLTLEVMAISGGSVSVTVEGRMGVEDDNWAPMAVIGTKN